jgi:hypothetical protein
MKSRHVDGYKGKRVEEINSCKGNVALALHLKRSMERKDKCEFTAIDPTGIADLRQEIVKCYQTGFSKWSNEQKAFVNEIGLELKDFEDQIRSDDRRPTFVEKLSPEASGDLELGLNLSWMDSVADEPGATPPQKKRKSTEQDEQEKKDKTGTKKRTRSSSQKPN